jgi:hypothetical protein
MASKIGLLRAGGEVLLSSLVLVAAGRFAFVATAPLLQGGPASAAAVDAPRTTTPQVLSELERDLRDLLERDARPRRVETTAAAEQPAVPDPGDRIEVMLSITAGGNRSDVFVDGAPVGQTAFVGQVGCHRGAALKIRIVPRRGEPLERTRICTGEMIFVSD